MTLADGTADSAAGKGGTAAGDILKNIENVQGSMHNDDITGNNAANDLFGWLGDDTLDGGGWPTSCAATRATTCSSAARATTGCAAARVPTSCTAARPRRRRHRPR